MAETTVAPNNRQVAYQGRARREYIRRSAFEHDQQSAGPDALGESETTVMPMQSKAQNAAMHAAAQGESTLGIPPSVGAKFVKEQHGKSLKGLPQRVKPKKAKRSNPRRTSAFKRGAISLSKLAKYGGKDQQPLDASSR